MLGAGASADYGLPVWDQLCPLIKEKISNDTKGVYQHKKEILAWIDQVGERKKYLTIDQCVEKEAVSKEFHKNGPAIETQIFLVIKDILTECYREGDGGWIRRLNRKILEPSESPFEGRIAFINYNYDDVLEKNLLNFEHLPDKYKQWNFRQKLNMLSSAKFSVLYPHGYLFAPEKLGRPSNIVRFSHTMKTDVKDSVDAVSCYESEYHTVVTGSNVTKLRLNILGIGGGLQVNLNHLSFDVPISEINVTIRNEQKIESVIKYLSAKFKMPPEKINIYSTCEDLIQNCF